VDVAWRRLIAWREWMPAEDDARSRGALLRAHRERLGMTQTEVAEGLARLAWLHHKGRVGVNADMVSKWERGTKAVSQLYQEMYCALFDVQAAELGFRGGVSLDVGHVDHGAGASHVLAQLGPAAGQLGPVVLDVWKEETMKRRTLLKLLSATPAAVSASGGSARSEPRLTVAGLDDLAGRYQALYHSAVPLDLMAPVVTHLRTIDRLMRDGPTPADRRRLLMNRSRVGTLAGRIAFFDLGDSMSARGYFTTAAEAAGEAGEPLLAAAALGHMAFIPAAEHSYSAARDYLNGASRQVFRSPHDGITAWLAAVESEILTNSGSGQLALNAADRAESAFAGDLHEDLPWFDYFDAGRLAGFRGYSQLRAGRLDEASSTLRAAADALPFQAVKQRAVFLADLATVELERREVEEACQLAIEAANALSLAGYATGADRLHELRQRLEPWHEHPAVGILDEHLTIS
jgi:hypothetical protein